MTWSGKFYLLSMLSWFLKKWIDAKRSAVKYEGVWENPLTEHAQFCASNFKFVKSNCPELVKFSWEVWINRAPHTEKLSFVDRNSV